MRTKWLAAAAAFLAVLGLLPLAFADLSLVDRLTHRVGAPETTFPAPVPDPDDRAEARFAVAGDVGTGDEREYRTAAAIARRAEVAPYSALLLLGDNVYPNGDPDRLGATVFTPFAPLLTSGVRLLPVLGNHDVRDGNGPGQLARFGRLRSWYAETIGPVQIIALDSTKPQSASQRRWLSGILAGPRPEWRIVIMHHPIHSSGVHGADPDVRVAFEEALIHGHVDLVLAGHEHDYQRTESIDGVVYVVSGAAAKLRRTGRESFTAYSTATRHFVEINAWSDRLRVTAIDQDGRAFDDVTLTDFSTSAPT